MMLFRRHLGIFMFLAAITHLILVSTIPKLFTYSAITLDIFPQREIFGIVAMLLLFPLWLTSNDYSVVHLGKYWEWIHRLTYFALFLIFLHVALLEFSLGLIGAMVIILEIISWIFTLKKIRPPRSGFKPD
jgi:sulfoxide reductase heme-binding subunit YedZ